MCLYDEINETNVMHREPNFVQYGTATIVESFRDKEIVKYHFHIFVINEVQEINKSQGNFEIYQFRSEISMFLEVPT